MEDKIYINGKEIVCDLQYNLLDIVYYYPNSGFRENDYVFYVDILRTSLLDFKILMDILYNRNQPVEFKNEFITCNVYIITNGCSVSGDLVLFDKYSPFSDNKNRFTITSIGILDDSLVKELKHNDKIAQRVFYK